MEDPHQHMNGCQEECMALSKRFLLNVAGREGDNTLYSQQSAVCMEEKELAGVCVLHLSKEEPL